MLYNKCNCSGNVKQDFLYYRYYQKSLVWWCFITIFWHMFLLQRTYHVSEIPSHMLPMTSVQEPVKEICLGYNILEWLLIILMQKTVVTDSQWGTILSMWSTCIYKSCLWSFLSPFHILHCSFTIVYLFYGY